MQKKTFPGSAQCPLCGGRITGGITTFTANLGTAVMIVRDVPAQICNQCEEEWFETEVSRRLDELAADMRERGAEVEILKFDAGKKKVMQD